MPPRAESSYRTTVGALAFGQLMCWAALYYAFSTFVLPMQSALGLDTPALMGAFSCGLVAWGACSYLVGAAIDRGHGRLVLTAGAALGGVGFVLWSQVQSLPALYAVWVLIGAAMALTLYEPAFNVLTKRYPDGYRLGITVVTLAGGFASTLSFPAAAALIATIGWRDALFVIGVALLVSVAPLHAWVLRGHGGSAARTGRRLAARAGRQRDAQRVDDRRRVAATIVLAPHRDLHALCVRRRGDLGAHHADVPRARPHAGASGGDHRVDRPGAGARAPAATRVRTTDDRPQRSASW